VDKAPVLVNFLNLISETVTMLDKNNLQFSVVIPDFYDARSASTPEFSYGGESGYTLDHLLAILDRKPGSTLLVMAYRNFSLGSGGAIDISKDEIREANATQTKVVVALETGQVDAPDTSLYGTSRAYYLQQVQDVRDAFAGNKSYGGIATDYIDALVGLK
jgi:hypothetical protein